MRLRHEWRGLSDDWGWRSISNGTAAGLRGARRAESDSAADGIRRNTTAVEAAAAAEAAADGGGGATFGAGAWFGVSASGDEQRVPHAPCAPDVDTQVPRSAAAQGDSPTASSSPARALSGRSSSLPSEEESRLTLTHEVLEVTHPLETVTDPPLRLHRMPAQESLMTVRYPRLTVRSRSQESLVARREDGGGVLIVPGGGMPTGERGEAAPESSEKERADADAQAAAAGWQAGLRDLAGQPRAEMVRTSGSQGSQGSQEPSGAPRIAPAAASQLAGASDAARHPYKPSASRLPRDAAPPPHAPRRANERVSQETAAATGAAALGDAWARGSAARTEPADTRRRHPAQAAMKPHALAGLGERSAAGRDRNTGGWQQGGRGGMKGVQGGKGGDSSRDGGGGAGQQAAETRGWEAWSQAEIVGSPLPLVVRRVDQFLRKCSLNGYVCAGMHAGCGLWG